MSDVSSWGDLSRPPLRAAALRRALVTGPGPWTSLDVVPATGSTNADLAGWVRSGRARPGAVLSTDDQRAGRGRRDRPWTAPPRSAIAVSAYLQPLGVPRQRWSWLPLLTGLGVLDALVRVCGLPATLKWPNDVLLGGRKVCGVLVEVVDGPDGTGVVLGLGVNVSQLDSELAVPTATSLALAGSAVTDRDTVLRAVLRAVGDRYLAWQDAAGEPRAAGIGAGYRESCDTIGRRVRVELPTGPALLGTAEGVDDDGLLLVRDDQDRLHPLAAGDVVHVRPQPGPESASHSADAGRHGMI